MADYTEKQVTLTFADDWTVSKYDEWAFHRNQLQPRWGGQSAVDFVAIPDDGQTLWLIELKDYRLSDAPNWDELTATVAKKARDTVTGLFAAKMNAHNDEKAIGEQSVLVSQIRIVLHIEESGYRYNSKIRKERRANIQTTLKQKVKPIDPHPLVVEIEDMRGTLWSARRN